MAGGNLGDLWFQLGVKDNTSKELQKIIDKLKTGDDAANSLLRALQGFGTKKSGFKEQAEKAKEFADVLNEINRRISKLKKNDKSDEAKDLQMAVKNALSYLDMLQRINIERSKISELRSLNPNVDTSKLKEAELMLENVNNQLFRLQNKAQGGGGGGVDYANVLQDYAKVLQMTFRDVKQITDQFKKENPLSAFSGGAAKVEADISRVTEKLAKMRDLMAEGTLKGYNTNMLGGSITELDKILARLQAASGNKSLLTDAAQMKNLLSNVAVEMTKATAATQAYGREKGKVIAQEKANNAALKEHENARSAEYTRKQQQQAQYLDQLNKEGLALQKNAQIQQRLTELQEKAWISQTKSGFRGRRYLTPGNAEAAQGYRDIANAYQTSANQLQSKYNEDKANFSKQLDEYAKTYKAIEDKLRAISPNMDGRGIDGKGLKGKDRSYYEGLVRDLAYMKKGAESEQMANISNLENQASKIKELIQLAERYNQLAGQVSKSTYKPYDFNSYEQKRISDTAALKNAILERYKAEQDAEKKRKKDEADAAREAKAAEKQRQREINITLNRVQALSYAMEKLQSVVTEGKRLNIDTSRAEAKIKELGQEIQTLNIMNSNLKGKDWKSYLGDVGQVGNGRSVKEANHLATELASVNREAQRGVELEQKRQQEIAKSAAKVQSDLVRGFEKANSHAGKLNSTVQDLKSLFLQGGLVFGAQQFAMSIITTGGEMEKQHIALQSILGDMQNANTMFNQIKELALNSPFTFSELNRDVKQLAAYGVEYDQLYDTTKRLADMSSGLGVSFDRIALAFGQVQARGWLDGKELRQIAYAGIPLLNKLSEFYSKQEGRNVSTSEIKTRISNREVSFDDVKSIFWQMTDAGGQFYNMQQILSETLLGKYNKLKDAWEIMLSDFASGQSIVGKTFKVAIEGVTGLVQALHTLAPVIVAAFSGFALKKAGTMIAGSYGANYLKNKASVASNIQSRVIQGQAISNVEKSVLATKNQITNAEVRQLVLANAIHKKELDRLFVEGKISASVYKQGLAAVGLVSGMTKAQVKAQLLGNTINRAASGNIWATFGARGLAAMSLIGNAVKGLGATLWSAIGGLPGLILTAVTMGITYAISKYQELSNAIDQTRSELKDREKQIADFRNTNVKAANDAIASGDTKEIDNLIETYKDKLKELAPYNFSNLEMTADEKKSHVDRLIYLDEELKRLQMANKEAQKHLDNRSFYSGLQDAFKPAQIDAHAVEEQKVKANAYNATDEDRNKLQRYTELYKRDINVLKQTLVKEFGDIGKDPTLLAAAMQALDSIAAQMGISEEQKETIRASILDSFGLQSGWLKEQVGIKMQSIIDEKFPEIAAKIKANIPLTQAEQEKVKELMQDAKQGLIRQYPELERTLQNLLAESNFQAVIKLVYDTGGKYNDVQSTLVGRIPSMINPKSSIGAKYRQRADEYGKDNDWYKANNLANQRIDDARNAWKGAVKSHAPNVKDIYQNYLDEMAISRTLLYNNYKGTDKKSNKPGKKNTHTNHEDKELKRLQERIELYKKMYAEIKKFKELYGEGALGQLANDGEFGAIFGDKKRFPISDYTNYETSIKELLKGFSLSTPERKHYAETQKAAIQSENRKLLQDQRRDELDLLNRELDVISAQYDTYKKLYELTGNKKGAENIAFDGAVQYDTYKKFLEKQLDIAVNHDNVQSGLKLTTDEVKGMSLDNVKDRYGSESRVYDIRKKLDDETRKIKQETIDLLANLVEKNATIDQQIEDENRKYERQLELIKGIKDTGMRDRATEGAEKTHNENLAKLEFERFKQGSDWVTIFDDLDRVSSTTINSMVEKIDEFSKTTGLSVEVVKQLRDALGKLRDEQIDRNPINGIIGGMQRGNAIGSFIDSRFRKGMDISTTTYVGADDAKKMGIQKGNYTKGQLEGEQKGAYADANNGVTKLAEKFKALQDCLSPVINLFEVLGEEDSFLGQATNMASGAFGAAAQVSGGLNALGLGNLGPYGAAAGAALSVVTSLFAMHDKALQKEIEASEERQKEFDNMTKNIKSIIEDTLGGIYSYKVSEDTKNTLNKVTSDYERSVVWKNSKTGKNFPFLFNSVYSSKTYEAAKEAQSKPNSAYHAELASLMAQRDELQSQRDSESKKKKKDDSKIADYNQQIKEMEQQINTFAQDFLKDIYSIDIKSWASELTDAVVGAWEKGEDAVEAYREKVKDMVKDVTKNIVTQKIMESALREPLNYLTGILKDKGKLDETDMDKLADMLYKAGDEVVPQITGIFEALKNRGWDFRDNGSSSSTKNSIQSITEETADIIASYLNSIRLDVSVNREYIKIISDYLKNIPEMNAIAQSQLDAMNQLVSLAEYRNDRLDDMYSWMRSVTKDTGSKSLRIS